MCGRYSFSVTKEKAEKRYDVKVQDGYKPRYNVAPTQAMPVITHSNPKEFSLFRWGLIPNWSLNESTATNLFNARAETILTKAPFKQIVKEKRCLIPADGFYEWKRAGKNKVPHRITLASDEPFCFAGIWDSWEDKKGDIINTYVIITTDANSLVRDIHDRMPVILPKDVEKDWLKSDLSDKDINELLKPYDPDKMSYYASHKIVNSVNYDTPECLHVAPKIYPGETFSLFDNY